MAAASEATFNSTIECPAKPTNYTCPKTLNLSKEELKNQICNYDSIITGTISLVPDSDKSQTRCGSLKVVKQESRGTGESGSDLPEKVAVVLAKECQVRGILDSTTTTVATTSTTKDATQSDTVYLLIKKTVSPGAKYLLIDGNEMDLLSSQIISKEEISGLMKQCPARKVSAN